LKDDKDIRNEERPDLQALHFQAEFPDLAGRTADDLKAANAGENHETERMCPEFAGVAEKEGYEYVATGLRAIGRAGKHHEGR
jgi:rubrerythrin